MWDATRCIGEMSDESPEETTTVEVLANGPFLVRGRVRVKDAEGHVVAEETRVALCRCGASQNKPFCDNTHRAIGFKG